MLPRCDGSYFNLNCSGRQSHCALLACLTYQLIEQRLNDLNQTMRTANPDRGYILRNGLGFFPSLFGLQFQGPQCFTVVQRLRPRGQVLSLVVFWVQQRLSANKPLLSGVGRSCKRCAEGHIFAAVHIPCCIRNLMLADGSRAYPDQRTKGRYYMFRAIAPRKNWRSSVDVS